MELRIGLDLRRVDGAEIVAYEVSRSIGGGGQLPTRRGVTAGLPTEVAEHEVGADAAAADRRQFTTVEVGQHDGAAGMAGGGSNQAVEQTGGLNLIAPAERFDDALDVATAVADFSTR